MSWNCADIEERLDDYLDGEMSPDYATRFDAHLNSCAACAAYVASERLLIGDLGQLGRFADRLAQFESKKQGVSSSRGNLVWLRNGGIAAAVAIAITAGYLIPMNQPNRDKYDATSEIPRPSARISRQPVRLALADDSRLVVPVPTDNEKMHIFWMYDVVQDDANAAAPTSPDGNYQISQPQATQKGQP